MMNLGRHRRRAAVFSVAAAMIAGACSSGSGDPENALGDSGVVSYGAEDSSPVTVAEVPDAYAALPIDVWAMAGAKVSYISNAFDVVEFGAVASDGNDDAWAFNKAIKAAVPSRWGSRNDS